MYNILRLKDENGKEVCFEFLDLIRYEGEEYVVLFPCEDPEDSKEVVILRVEELSGSDDEEVYASLESEEILQTVFRLFRQRNEENFLFQTPGGHT